ncbi:MULTISPECIES: DUF397 domain-containing protein [unclassified Streptomyces]
MNSTELTWFKSSYSTNDGPRLGFAPAAWADFVAYASEA